MRTVAEGKRHVKRLLGKQRITNTKYRMMKYVLRAECDDGVLLHNCITGQLVLLSADESELLSSSLFEINNEFLKTLVEDYYLVPTRYNEKQLVDQLRKLIKRLFIPKGINSYTILTTTNCNARCFYCYQNGYQHTNMSEETARKLIDYMISNKSDDELRLHWFGGEPLMGVARIDQICSLLRLNGIRYTSTMISNGYLISDEIADKAVNTWNLKRIQITLDGTEEIYNKTKAYVYTQESPYKRVKKNIQKMIDRGVHVSVRMNLDQHNADDLINLADDLINTVGKSQFLSAYSRVLFENEGSKPIARNEDITKALFNKQIEINSYLEQLGLTKRSYHLPAVETHHCIADSDDSVVVFPDGKLFRCEHTQMGDEYGCLDQDIIDEENFNKYRQTVEPLFCHDCALYPKCILLKECNGKGIEKRRKLCQYENESIKRSMVEYWIHNSVFK